MLTIYGRLHRYLGTPYTLETIDLTMEPDPTDWRCYRLVNQDGTIEVLSRSMSEINTFVRGFQLGQDDSRREAACGSSPPKPSSDSPATK